MKRERTATETIDRTRNAIAYFLIGSFSGALIGFMSFAMPETNKDIITYMVGQLSGMAMTALGFYFVNKVGSDAREVKQAEQASKMADAMVAVTRANPVDPNLEAAEAAEAVADAAAEKADEIRGPTT